MNWRYILKTVPSDHPKDPIEIEYDLNLMAG